MKKIKKIAENALAFALVIAMIVASCTACKKPPVVPPTYNISVTISNLTQNSVTIKVDGIPKNNQEAGIYLATHPEPGAEDLHVARLAQDGQVTINLFSLEPGTKYYLRGYMKSSGEFYYSNDKEFTTRTNAETLAATSISTSEATLNGVVYLIPGMEVTYWFQWGQGSQLINNTEETTINGSESKAVASILTNLPGGTDHSFRLAIKIENEIFYGQTASFKTLGAPPQILEITEINLPAIDKLQVKFKINSNQLPTTVSVQYNTSPNSGTILTQGPFTGNDIVVDFNLLVVPLNKYFFKITATNIAGASNALDSSSYSAAFEYEGYVYKSVQIGDRWWMQENFKGLTYQNGDAIPYIYDAEEWRNSTEGAVCYNEHSQENYDTYGALYNWYVTQDPRKIAPPGWRVPTDDDLSHNLQAAVGVFGAPSLRETGYEHWMPFPGINPTNSSGWTARGAGGFAIGEGEDIITFGGIKTVGMWWSQENTISVGALAIEIRFNDNGLYFVVYYKFYGASLRFIKE